MTPVRIQRKRTRGWKMPLNTVYVGRPHPLGNPFVMKVQSERDESVRLYEEFVKQRMERKDIFGIQFRVWIGEIKGKNLACWCPLDKPCHADILLEIANAPPSKDGDTKETR